MQFKIRASAAGQIMTNPRSKREVISKTALTYVHDWLKERIYGHKKEINNKYVNKGLMLEDEAIDTAIELLDLQFVLKNEQSFENDWFIGTPDLIFENELIDVKCSWDCYTFPLFEKEIPTKDYYYQLQVYMALTGKRKARLVYVLLDTPQELSFEPIETNYKAMDKKYRIKTYDVEYNDEVIEELKQRVLTINKLINEQFK